MQSKIKLTPMALNIKHYNGIKHCNIIQKYGSFLIDIFGFYYSLYVSVQHLMPLV